MYNYQIVIYAALEFTVHTSDPEQVKANLVKGSVVVVMGLGRTLVNPYPYREVGFHRRRSDHVLPWMRLRSKKRMTDEGTRTGLTATETTTSVEHINLSSKKEEGGRKKSY